MDCLEAWGQNGPPHHGPALCGLILVVIISNELSQSIMTFAISPLRGWRLLDCLLLRWHIIMLNLSISCSKQGGTADPQVHTHITDSSYYAYIGIYIAYTCTNLDLSRNKHCFYFEVKVPFRIGTWCHGVFINLIFFSFS